LVKKPDILQLSDLLVAEVAKLEQIKQANEKVSNIEQTRLEKQKERINLKKRESESQLRKAEEMTIATRKFGEEQLIHLKNLGVEMAKLMTTSVSKSRIDQEGMFLKEREVIKQQVKAEFEKMFQSVTSNRKVVERDKNSDEALVNHEEITTSSIDNRSPQQKPFEPYITPDPDIEKAWDRLHDLERVVPSQSALDLERASLRRQKKESMRILEQSQKAKERADVLLELAKEKGKINDIMNMVHSVQAEANQRNRTAVEQQSKRVLAPQKQKDIFPPKQKDILFEDKEKNINGNNIRNAENAERGDWTIKIVKPEIEEIDPSSRGYEKTGKDVHLTPKIGTEPRAEITPNIQENTSKILPSNLSSDQANSRAVVTLENGYTSYSQDNYEEFPGLNISSNKTDTEVSKVEIVDTYKGSQSEDYVTVAESYDPSGDSSYNKQTKEESFVIESTDVTVCETEVTYDDNFDNDKDELLEESIHDDTIVTEEDILIGSKLSPLEKVAENCETTISEERSQHENDISEEYAGDAAFFSADTEIIESEIDPGSTLKSVEELQSDIFSENQAIIEEDSALEETFYEDHDEIIEGEISCKTSPPSLTRDKEIIGSVATVEQTEYEETDVFESEDFFEEEDASRLDEVEEKFQGNEEESEVSPTSYIEDEECSNSVTNKDEKIDSPSIVITDSNKTSDSDCRNNENPPTTSVVISDITLTSDSPDADQNESPSKVESFSDPFLSAADSEEATSPILSSDGLLSEHVEVEVVEKEPEDGNIKESPSKESVEDLTSVDISEQIEELSEFTEDTLLREDKIEEGEKSITSKASEEKLIKPESQDQINKIGNNIWNGIWQDVIDEVTSIRHIQNLTNINDDPMMNEFNQFNGPSSFDPKQEFISGLNEKGVKKYLSNLQKILMEKPNWNCRSTASEFEESFSSAIFMRSFRQMGDLTDHKSVVARKAHC